MARKTLSSTDTERVKSVEIFAPVKATWLALPLRAGPAGGASLAVPSPGCSEMRVVLGVQLDAPRQVSRMNT